MAEGDAVTQNNGKKLALDLLAAHTLKVAICHGSQPAADGTLRYQDLTEISASNYTAGGIALSNVAVTQNDTPDTANLDADDVEWTALGTPAVSPGSADFGALVDHTDSTKRVIGTWAITKQPNGGNYKIAFNALGVIVLS
jgi:hypothetical protein